MHLGASAVGTDARLRDAGDAAAHLPYRSGYTRRFRLASVPGDPSKVYLLYRAS